MRIGEYVVRTSVYEGADYQIYVGSREMENALVSLFVFPDEVQPESPKLSVFTTFRFQGKFVVVTENVGVTLQSFLADTADHPDRNTFIATLFRDVLDQLPFDSFSPHNVFVQKSRSGFVRARLGLRLPEDLHFAAPEPERGEKSSIWSAGICLYYMIT